MGEVCRFGKYKGLDWSEVPMDYLAWVVTKMRVPPVDEITPELRRRAAQHGSRDSMDASDLLFVLQLRATKNKRRQQQHKRKVAALDTAGKSGSPFTQTKRKADESADDVRPSEDRSRG